jgi:hypothetical protein
MMYGAQHPNNHKHNEPILIHWLERGEGHVCLIGKLTISFAWGVN